MGEELDGAIAGEGRGGRGRNAGGVLPSELIVRARLRLLSEAGVSKSLDGPRQT